VLGPAQTLAISAALQVAPGPEVHIDVRPPQRGPVTLYAVELDVVPGRFAQGVRRARRVACESPCDRVVDVSQSPAFEIGGRRTSRSRTFTLPPDGTAQVDVAAGRKGARIAGWIFNGLGGGGLLAGVGMMVFADNSKSLLTAGGITLGSSIPFIIAGAVMVVTSRTRVSVRYR
jgi:hypothetical protein